MCSPSCTECSPSRKCSGWGFTMETDRKGRLMRGKNCCLCHATGKRIRVGRWPCNRWARIYRVGTC
ncbi:hypothetical protein [Streptomyces sp. NPDC096152]|uniref:hypothetical protein n=1 Tax=Streptomyces sp. NPDC096152 TaxID=3366078 RepID=UPI00382C0178